MRFSPLSQHILNLNQIKVRAGINVNLIFGHAKVFSFVYIPWMCCPRCCFICIEESPTQRAGKWGNLCAATPQFGIPFVVCCLLPKPRNSFSLFLINFCQFGCQFGPEIHSACLPFGPHTTGWPNVRPFSWAG